ncbi:MAG: DUF4397 domain-containing protein [candidate division Zixibacteria bacterium]|nr:DUF4397 domain-containing protein [candidate division Zixibacteria bacterium]
MKTLNYILAALILTAVSFSVASADTARLQVIHNSADLDAEVVDVYVNESLFIDDFAFRTATPFVDVAADVELSIGVAPANSNGVEDVIASFPVTFAMGETYVAVANGLLDPDMYSENPDGRETAFTLFANGGIAEESGDPEMVKVLALHGSSDAPTVDVQPKISWPRPALFDDIAYGDFTDYAMLAPQSYVLHLTPGSDEFSIVTSFDVNLSGLDGGAAVVFASGFLVPENNQNGAPFGLFAALPNGDVVEFPAIEAKSRFQLIHNSADPAAEFVDIYLNGELGIKNFEFRKATPFVDAPSDLPITVSVAPGNSNSVDDAIAEFEVILEAGQTYAAVANGVLDPDQFAENPEGLNIAFGIYPRMGVLENYGKSEMLNMLTFHGATDAPTIDILIRDVGVNTGMLIIDDLTYGEYSDYVMVERDVYILDITLGDNNSEVVASFKANANKGVYANTGIVFASGFLNPENNQNGAEFGLFLANPDGTVNALDPYTDPVTARLQVIHNSADPAAEVVDLYVGDDLCIDDFAFRTASPFVDVPANEELYVGIAPANSNSAEDTIASFPVYFMEGETYVAVANGVIDPNGFAENPDGESIALTLFARDGISESCNDLDMVKVIALHGSTDAPTVDVVPLYEDLTYGEFSDYAMIPADEYVLAIKPADDSTITVAEFIADLSGLGGGTAVVFASGFLAPENNQNGEAFGLWAALPNGTVVEFPVVQGSVPTPINDEEALNREGNSELPTEFALKQNYPNPFNPSTSITFSLPSSSQVDLRVFNMLGQEVEALVNGQMDAGVHQITFDASNLTSGVYFYKLTAGDYKETKKMMFVK